MSDATAPTATTIIELRCNGTRRDGKFAGRVCWMLLAEQITPPYQIRCTRCATVNCG